MDELPACRSNNADATMSSDASLDAEWQIDFAATPERAGAAISVFFMEYVNTSSCLEPAAGTGKLTAYLRDAFPEFSADESDSYLDGRTTGFDWIVCHPPLSLAARFIDKMILEARDGAAALLPLTYIERAPTPKTLILFGDSLPIGAIPHCWLVWTDLPTPAFYWA